VLFPEFVPLPDAAPSFGGKAVTKLVGEHDDLAPMVSFVRKHVSEHGASSGPGRYEGIAGEFCDAAIG